MMSNSGLSNYLAWDRQTFYIRHDKDYLRHEHEEGHHSSVMVQATTISSDAPSKALKSSILPRRGTDTNVTNSNVTSGPHTRPPTQ